jgi:hypothetical protein
VIQQFLFFNIRNMIRNRTRKLQVSIRWRSVAGPRSVSQSTYRYVILFSEAKMADDVMISYCRKPVYLPWKDLCGLVADLDYMSTLPLMLIKSRTINKLQVRICDITLDFWKCNFFMHSRKRYSRFCCLLPIKIRTVLREEVHYY